MKTGLLLSGILFTVTSLFAQTNKLNIGITAGPSSNYLYGYEIIPGYHSAPLIAFTGGLTVQYNLPKVVSFVSGILYEQKGKKTTGRFANINGIQTDFIDRRRFNYLTIPLLARFSFGKKTSFFVEGGGFVSYLTRVSTLFDGPPVNYLKSRDTYLYKRLDVGVSVGLGVSIPLNDKFLLTVEGRNSLGLYNISEPPLYKDKSIKTNSTSLLLGIAYKLGKRSA